jgi:hypothetical protein
LDPLTLPCWRYYLSLLLLLLLQSQKRQMQAYRQQPPPLLLLLPMLSWRQYQGLWHKGSLTHLQPHRCLGV